MRKAAVAIALAGLATACAIPEQTSDRSACVRLFQDYDRLAQFRPTETVDRRGRERLDPALSRLQVLLIQNDCQTRARDLGGLEAAAEARAGDRVVERGAPLGRPVAVHVGALTGEAEAARAVAFFEGLGLRATSIGNRQLGRRVYVGPVTTEGALGEVIAIAFEAGFVAPYPSQFFRF
jgi:hypothetical protein